MSGQQGGESPSGTTIRNYTDLPIIDQYGNAWALSQSGQVMVDGVIDWTTSGVAELAYINRQIWQWVVAKRLWWSKTSPIAPWLPVSGTPNAPFGPTPDPRLDQILVALETLAASDAAASGMLAGLIGQLHADVRAIPTEILPDPRIDALAGQVRQLTAAVALEQGALASQISALNSLQTSQWTAVMAELADMGSSVEANATSIAALMTQVERIVVMILDLFPGAGTTQIVANLSNATHTETQPVPEAPGP